MKMPVCLWERMDSVTYLVGVFLVDLEDLPERFLKWDTEYYLNEFDSYFHYPLPKKGTFMVLVLFTSDGSNEDVWTTIRKWTPQKERYYAGMVGSRVEIEVK